MLAEYPTPQSFDQAIEAPIDVVVLSAPDHDALPQQLLDAITQMQARGGTAVLVVFPRLVDAEILQRVADAGASHCVVAPSSSELFSHIERARSQRRHAAVTEVDPLDTFWRTRSRYL